MKTLNTSENDKIILEKERLKLKYNQRLESIKQHYGLDFEVYYLKDENMEKIKFLFSEHKNVIKNISLIYDSKLLKFNYIAYDYDNEKVLKNYNDQKIINELNREKKLFLVIDEIKKANEEYKIELERLNSEKIIKIKTD